MTNATGRERPQDAECPDGGPATAHAGGRSGEDRPTAVLVVLADGTETRIGPLAYRCMAERLVHGFEGMRHSTTGADTARSEIVDYDPGVRHLPLVAASTEAILSAWEAEGGRADGPFPDLWARLSAQHGYDTAMPAWTTACAHIDHMAQEAEWTAAETEARAELRQKVTEAVRRFGEHCATAYADAEAFRAGGGEHLEEIVGMLMVLMDEK